MKAYRYTEQWKRIARKHNEEWLDSFDPLTVIVGNEGDIEDDFMAFLSLDTCKKYIEYPLAWAGIDTEEDRIKVIWREPQQSEGILEGVSITAESGGVVKCKLFVIYEMAVVE
jgi:hypothetical protein